jgi:hypothetical protein
VAASAPPPSAGGEAVGVHQTNSFLDGALLGLGRRDFVQQGGPSWFVLTTPVIAEARDPTSTAAMSFSSGCLACWLSWRLAHGIDGCLAAASEAAMAFSAAACRPALLCCFSRGVERLQRDQSGEGGIHATL